MVARGRSHGLIECTDHAVQLILCVPGPEHLLAHIIRHILQKRSQSMGSRDIKILTRQILLFPLTFSNALFTCGRSANIWLIMSFVIVKATLDFPTAAALASCSPYGSIQEWEETLMGPRMAIGDQVIP